MRNAMGGDITALFQFLSLDHIIQIPRLRARQPRPGRLDRPGGAAAVTIRIRLATLCARRSFNRTLTHLSSPKIAG